MIEESVGVSEKCEAKCFSKMFRDQRLWQQLQRWLTST